MKVRTIRNLRVFLVGFIIFTLTIAATPVSSPEPIPPQSAVFIPTEGEMDILQLQFPEKYPSPLILPDLHTLPPSDLKLQIIHGLGITRLRFSNTIWNSGPGHLELRATPFPKPGTVQVTQIYFSSDGTQSLNPSGLFEFHDEHGHWHWEGFSLYQVWSVLPTGKIDQIVASSDKVGYCLIDVDAYQGPDEIASEDIETPSEPQFTECIWTRQGISSGWTDTYKAHIEGQFVDITNLDDGIYALQSTVDPDDLIREVDDSNNSSLLYFNIEGDHLAVLGQRYYQPKPRPSPK